MIVDTSAVVAVLLGEPPADRIVDLLIGREAAMSAATLTELGIVVGRLAPQQARRLDALLTEWQVEVVPFTAEHARIARDAYRDYGRGSGHPARLNLGDCFAYALATERRDELLFVGDDFVRTDLRAALA
ncbi:type II toxin-antitoxin system VapC family toxin [Isoptericola dokdonensis]|uniref:Ribonuclease VapC n=1 Tax=Isoptericola dokdonensis DS-3 TaxID=1300344 RepID=A0A161I8Y6_9MICO|nr:type II toxin-antitoxin system VapC family toxin [Isoptericola dokdonensis]ANC32278.1 Ribonuclease VapC28 [Isoptericola dokdonensis DS-3]